MITPLLLSFSLLSLHFHILISYFCLFDDVITLFRHATTCFRHAMPLLCLRWWPLDVFAALLPLPPLLPLPFRYYHFLLLLSCWCWYCRADWLTLMPLRQLMFHYYCHAAITSFRRSFSLMMPCCFIFSSWFFAADFISSLFSLLLAYAFFADYFISPLSPLLFRRWCWCHALRLHYAAIFAVWCWFSLFDYTVAFHYFRHYFIHWRCWYAFDSSPLFAYFVIDLFDVDDACRRWCRFAWCHDIWYAIDIFMMLPITLLLIICLRCRHFRLRWCFSFAAAITLSLMLDMLRCFSWYGCLPCCRHWCHAILPLRHALFWYFISFSSFS